MTPEILEALMQSELVRRELPPTMSFYTIDSQVACFRVSGRDQPVSYLVTKAPYGLKPNGSPIKYSYGIEFSDQESPNKIRAKIRAAAEDFRRWLGEHTPLCTLSKEGHCECEIPA